MQEFLPRRQDGDLAGPRLIYKEFFYVFLLFFSLLNECICFPLNAFCFSSDSPDFLKLVLPQTALDSRAAASGGSEFATCTWWSHTSFQLDHNYLPAPPAQLPLPLCLFCNLFPGCRQSWAASTGGGHGALHVCCSTRESKLFVSCSPLILFLSCI